MALLEAPRPLRQTFKIPEVPVSVTKNLSPKELIQKHYSETLPYSKLQQLSRHKQQQQPYQQLRQLKQANTLRSSGPQGQIVPYTQINDPAFWYSSTFSNNQDYIYKLSEQDLQEIDAALQNVTASGKAIQDITKEDFKLPTLGPKLVQFKEEVRIGRGFQLIQGFPVDRYNNGQIITAYWGMGQYWGNMASQNKKGHFLGHIRNIDADVQDPSTRVYMTNLAQPFHTDSCDQVSLLCIQPAKSGGDSSWTSSVTIHNELLNLGREDLVEVLTKEFYQDRKGEIPKGKKPYFNMPVFSYYKGNFQTAYSATYYELAQRHDEVPRLTEKQEEALLWFASLAQSEKLRMDYVLQPGDIQLLNNHTMLHNRTEYVEHEDPEKRRHLLRLWIAPENERELPSQYEDYFGSTSVGNRGGIIVPEVNYNRVPLKAE